MWKFQIKTFTQRKTPKYDWEIIQNYTKLQFSSESHHENTQAHDLYIYTRKRKINDDRQLVFNAIDYDEIYTFKYRRTIISEFNKTTVQKNP